MTIVAVRQPGFDIRATAPGVWMGTLRVAIDCRLEDPRQGIWTATLALAHGLSSLKGTGQTYTFLVPEHLVDALHPYISGACSILPVPSRRRTAIGTVARRFGFAREVARVIRGLDTRIPRSDGILEKAGFDVVHFPTQIAYLTNVPSIYQPWDLQHLHYPQFFRSEEIRRRERQYRAFCSQASIICVQTEWGKRDIAAHYGVAHEKVQVVRWGSVFETYSPPTIEEIGVTRRELGLPARFVVYPAVTWPHKNHELIIRSLALLRASEQQQLHAVFTGAITDYKKHLTTVAKELHIENRIHFLGFVSSKQLAAIFRAAVAMVFPSRFEGLGLPVLEAFQAGLPVVSSNATVLPEVAGDAALLFDPDSPEELSCLICRIAESEELRASLIERGRRMLSSNTALHTAEEFVRSYKMIAGGSVANSSISRIYS